MSLISRRRSFENVAAIDTSATIQIVMTVVAFGVAVYYLKKVSVLRNLTFYTPLKWFLFYTLWAAISSLWSIQGLMSAYRAFEALAWFLLLCSVISRLYESLEPVEIIKWVLYYAVFAIAFNILHLVLRFGFSVLSIDILLIEQMGSTPYFFLALLLPVGLLVKIFILPISIFSVSNTAYAGMAGGLLAFLMDKGRLRQVLILVIIGVLVAIATIGTNLILQKTIFYGQGGVGIEYTTGRDKIAILAMKEAKERPFTGFGFAAGETYIINKVHRGAIGAHNGLLSAQLGTGLIGTVLLSIFLVKVITIAGSRYLPTELRTVFLASAILITVQTLGNPGIGSRVYGTWIPAILIISLICLVQQHYEYQYFNDNYMNDY
jgi:hypothetical protein